MLELIFQKELILIKQMHQKIMVKDIKDIGFKYKPCLCNGCHDLMQKVMSFNDSLLGYEKR